MTTEPRLLQPPTDVRTFDVYGRLLNDRIVLLWILSLRGEPMPPLEYWLSPLIGTAVWPWLFLLLDRYRGVMRLRSAP